MRKRIEVAYTDVLAQTRDMLVQSRADLARMQQSIAHSLFWMNESRIALDATRDMIREEAMRPRVVPVER